MKASILAVLMTIIFTGTALAHEPAPADSFTTALQTYTQSVALVTAASDDAEANGYEGISQQSLENELSDALDRMESLVVESCYRDWYRIAVVMVQVNITYWEHMRTGDTVGANNIAGALPALNSLLNEYQTDAVVACGFEEEEVPTTEETE